MNEKENRFKIVASRRTNAILKQLKLLANCSNTHNYEFTEAQVNKIFAAIDDQLKTTKNEFSKQKKKGPFEL